MWGLSRQQKYWLWTGAADMRRGFDGLSGLVRRELRAQDVLSGDAFVFVNKRRTQMKILVWESGGFLLYHKRLEAGTFELPTAQDGNSLAWEALFFMVEGVKLSGLARRKRFAFPDSDTSSKA
jgi:transposase